jgi:hypothetical protein
VSKESGSPGLAPQQPYPDGEEDRDKDALDLKKVRCVAVAGLLR